MHRQDYELLAVALATAYPVPNAPHFGANVVQWTRCVDSIADVLSVDNPRFDRELFHQAVALAVPYRNEEEE